MVGARASRSTIASKALLNKSIPPCKAERRQCWSTSFSANFMPVELFHNTIPISSVVLEEDFRFRKEAYLTFSLEVNDSTSRKAVGYFQVNIENAMNYIDHVCYWNN